jgi:probable phosphoglycerate mutase
LPVRFVYLIRHAEPALPDKRRRFLGARSNPPLSSAGVGQAELLGRRFEQVHFDAVWSSSLTRSLQTAEIVSGQPAGAIHVEPRLREIDLGLWDGLSDLEVQQRYPSEWAERESDLVGYRFPQGETYRELQTRALAAFISLAEAAVRAQHQNILVVGHKGVNRVILGHFLGGPFEDLFTIRQDYCAVNLLQSEVDSQGRLRIRVRALAS